jgi:hypothetical protein
MHLLRERRGSSSTTHVYPVAVQKVGTEDRHEPIDLMQKLQWLFYQLVILAGSAAGSSNYSRSDVWNSCAFPFLANSMPMQQLSSCLKLRMILDKSQKQPRPLAALTPLNQTAAIFSKPEQFV